ncbi:MULTISPECIES: ATP-binding cassette domain-containing protein [unclassified Actinopolyspora]|uniref:ATP-binding cassette domain-containing protein n=1 Tax=unclassified Actinopolyspora TaxID=2639451 RepID=UPI0013F60C78|nr:MULTISPECIES: ATP-binding cassette domain-containing protein [unclassified Actinopolyspora]NHD16100.1 ATP-binding cassette domain-containing protein [Actinopolyspora sp. BKK2]NHE74686.1 ATP-binding cassette domain-containing protein [Actinopolyspora sp. BKK1]
MAAVRCENLRKRFGGVDAVAGIDLAVAEGEKFAFLGPNGAGKTTTVNMLATLLRPTGGAATVAGFDVTCSPDRVRERIGLVFQEQVSDGDLTVEENLLLHSVLYGVPRNAARKRMAALLELMGLAERGRHNVTTLSGGMRRRLEIARCLMHNPRVLFLDEPTAGLDPHARALVWELLDRLRDEQGITLFLTTHYLAEAERCDRVAILDAGALVAEGTPQELEATIGADVVQLRTGDDALAARNARCRLGVEVSGGAEGLRIHAADGPELVPRLCSDLGVRVDAVSVSRPSLEDVFMHYTGRSLQE